MSLLITFRRSTIASRISINLKQSLNYVLGLLEIPKYSNALLTHKNTLVVTARYVITSERTLATA